MEERILEFIKKNAKEVGIEVEKDTVISETIDSITFVEMVVALETEFNFEFDDEMLSFSNFETIGQLVDYVKAHSE